MALAAFVANDIANWICRAVVPTTLTTAVRMSLHTSDPLAAGTSEASTATGYARQVANYAAASGGACALTATLSFTGLVAATYTHIGLWDNNATTPKFLLGAPLSAPQNVPAASTINITAATTAVVQS